MMTTATPAEGDGGARSTTARIYNALSPAGRDHRASDRATADALDRCLPGTRLIAPSNRHCLQRMVAYAVELADLGAPPQVLDIGATDFAAPAVDCGNSLGYTIASRVQERTDGRWIALWGPYSQELTVFWRGPAPSGGYRFSTSLEYVWDSIAAADLEMALLNPFRPPPGRG